MNLQLHYGSSRTLLETAKFSTTSTGATALVAADPTHKIRVLGFIVEAVTATNLKFQSATTDITALMRLAATGRVVYPTGAGLCETAVNEALNINQSGTAQIDGTVVYARVE